jgi:hypothetical protein
MERAVSTPASTCGRRSLQSISFIHSFHSIQLCTDACGGGHPSWSRECSGASGHSNRSRSHGDRGHASQREGAQEGHSKREERRKERTAEQTDCSKHTIAIAYQEPTSMIAQNEIESTTILLKSNIKYKCCVNNVVSTKNEVSDRKILAPPGFKPHQNGCD